MNGPARVISRVRAGCWWLAAALALVGALRLVWVASRLETAPGLLAVMAQDATLGWLGHGHRPIGTERGEQQAEFWVSESKRVLAKNREAELARGAAWMLDRPAMTCGTAAWQPQDLSVYGRYWFQSHRDYDDFRRHTLEALLDSTNLATQLAPDDPQNWRVRATLLVVPIPPALRLNARTPAALEVLEEARKHDPENAYYDLLAAAFCSSDLRVPRHMLLAGEVNTREYEIHPLEEIMQSRLARAMTLERAQRETLDWQAIQRFLQVSSVPKHEHPLLIYTRLLRDGETENIEIELASRFQANQALAFSPERLLRLAARVHTSRLLIGAVSPDSRPAITRRARATVPAGLLESTRASHTDWPTTEQQKWIEGVTSTLTEINAWEMADWMHPAAAPPAAVRSWPLYVAVACEGALRLAAVAAILASVAGLCAWLLPKVDDHPRWSRPIWRQAVCWACALGVSFVWLGLAPAGLIPPSPRQAIGRLLTIACPALLVGSVLLFLTMHFRSAWGRLVVLGLILLCGAIIGTQRHRYEALIGPDANWFTAEWRMGELPIIAKSALDPKLETHTLPWSWIQWNLFPGPAAAACLALVLIALWHWCWISRRRNSQAKPPMRKRLQATLTEAARAGVLPAILALLCFMALAPGVLRRADETYQRQMSQIAAQAMRLEQIAAEAAAILADPAREAEMRAWARQQLQSEARP